MPRTHLVLFYTQGAPFDSGIGLADTHAAVVAAAASSFDEIHSYTLAEARSLANRRPGCAGILDPETDPALRDYSTATVGFFAFKPLIILDALEKVNAGDLVVYHDVNSSKYREYACTDWPAVPALMRRALSVNQTDVFAPFQEPDHPSIRVANFVKSSTLRRVLGRPLADDDPAFDSPLVRANRFAAVRSPAALAFVQEWLDLCCQKDLIAPLPNPDPHPLFRWNNGDQDTLNALILAHKQDGRLPPHFPLVWFRDNTLTESHWREWRK